MSTVAAQRLAGSFVAIALILSACGGSAAAPIEPETAAAAALTAVVPAGGATGVDPRGAITLTFSHAMPMAAQMYVELHRDSLTGPAVAGTTSWSADGRVLTFTPGAPLEPRTTYVLHVGGGMTDINGHPVDYTQCPGFGGRSVTASMMGGGGGMGGMMGGGASAPGEMGPGWRGGDGNYGMSFTFTTA